MCMTTVRGQPNPSRSSEHYCWVLDREGQELPTASREAQGMRVMVSRAASSLVSQPRMRTERQAVTTSWNSSSSSATLTWAKHRIQIKVRVSSSRVIAGAIRRDPGKLPVRAGSQEHHGRQKQCSELRMQKAECPCVRYNDTMSSCEPRFLCPVWCGASVLGAGRCFCHKSAWVILGFHHTARLMCAHSVLERRLNNTLHAMRPPSHYCVNEVPSAHLIAEGRVNGFGDGAAERADDLDAVLGRGYDRAHHHHILVIQLYVPVLRACTCLHAQ